MSSDFRFLLCYDPGYFGRRDG
uniref:Uncharacterized protein n=1 Tax=Lepeophtheirus salmonis TaxID=72036 RepID=A0A0K2TCZ0_LEPSM